MLTSFSLLNFLVSIPSFLQNPPHTHRRVFGPETLRALSKGETCCAAALQAEVGHADALAEEAWGDAAGSLF